MLRGLAVAVAMLLMAAVPAQAANVDCDGLQAALDSVGDGTVITLTEMCHGQSFQLPNFDTPDSDPGQPAPDTYISWTLNGTAGAGFDGTGAPGRVLTGTDVHDLEIDDLTFVNSDATGNGGAISIDGESGVIIRRSSFFGNTATGKGGAVYLGPITRLAPGEPLNGVVIDSNTFGSQTTPGDNTAQTGGALAVETPGQGQNSSYHDNLFFGNSAKGDGGAFTYLLQPGNGENLSVFGNQVVGNRAGGSGGGGWISGQIGFMNVTGELYQGNSVEPTSGAPAGDHFGGGLFLGVSSPNLRDDTFKSNSIKTFADGEDYGGGGLAVIASSVVGQSEFTRIEGNSVAGQPDGDFESEGGGFHLSGVGIWNSFLDAFAGNSIGALGAGGGIYTGAAIVGTHLNLVESTVAGNTAGGQFAGIAGDANDTLRARNSIIYNGGPGDIGGFGSYDLQYTDACNDGPDPFAGEGNMCADPLLAGGTDVHQTAQSPTIDAGSDALMSEGPGERPNTDYEGDPRPTDGDGDGHTVDMGADESPAFVAGPPPPPHVPQCSDGSDNDGDGAVDGQDPGCLSGPTDDNEGDETPGDLVLCGSREISLVRADAKGSKVSLSGFVATKHAGEKVALSVRYLGKGGKPKQLGTVRAKPDGSFKGLVAKPSRKLFKLARYRAQVGGAKSIELKLPQSLASSSLKQSGGTLVLRGQVDRALLGKRNPVVVKRILCGRYTTVGQAKPDRKGRYTVRFPAPATTTGSALYRAETKVLARPGSRRYVKQFARAIGITF
jgi:hypothetical protein